MKHTPGPWFINEERQKCMGDEIVFRSIYHKRSGLDVCIMQNNVIVNNLDKRERSEGEANAHLIAAAPDLLEACKIVLPYIDAYPKMKDLAKMLEQAISKAESK